MQQRTLTAECARRALSYDPITGELRRLRDGRVAGTLSNGYRKIYLEGRIHCAHRLAWLIMTGEHPPHEVDHINGERDDNRWCNLRSATKAQNSWNKKCRINNTSGETGVSWHSGSARWRAEIMVHGQFYFLGSYATKEEAVAAYKGASIALHGEFRRAAKGEAILHTEAPVRVQYSHAAA